MPQVRKEVLANGEVYHVLNHSIADEEIFYKSTVLRRTLDLINYYRFPQKLRFSQFKNLPKEAKETYYKEFLNSEPLVKIYAYAFMPNHYHLLLRQTQNKGITIFISNFQNSFAKYLNKKDSRQGSVFQRPFRSRRITSDEILMHVSRYIHLNPITSFIVNYKNHENYPWTSYLDYLGKREIGFVETEFILKLFGSRENYEKFVSNQVDYQRKLHKIKKYLLE